MSKVTLKDTRISELVDQNYVHAYVLFYFGIKFYEYSALTLEQVCKQRGLKVEQVVREMESPSYLREAELPLVSYPIDLIIEYLGECAIAGGMDAARNRAASARSLLVR